MFSQLHFSVADDCLLTFFGARSQDCHRRSHFCAARSQDHHRHNRALTFFCCKVTGSSQCYENSELQSETLRPTSPTLSHDYNDHMTSTTFINHQVTHAQHTSYCDVQPNRADTTDPTADPLNMHSQQRNSKAGIKDMQTQYACRTTHSVSLDCVAMTLTV